MRILDLREHETRRVPRTELTDDEALRLARSGKFDVEAASALNGYTYAICSRGLVGYFPVSHEVTVRVSPKVPIGNLFGMLEVVYNLRQFKLLEGVITVSSLEQIYERLVSILARRVLDRARRGLYRAYVSEEDELSNARGRIDPVGTARRIAQGMALLCCSFEEHTEDIEDNQILLWALHQVPGASLRRPQTRRELGMAHRVLSGAVSLNPKTGAEIVSRFYQRLNDDYRVMHGLCRFILETSGPSMAEGGHEFIPFVVDMPSLFEGFVATWLREHGPASIVVRPQFRAILEANHELKIKVDIVLFERSSRRPIAVLDTKYKSTETPAEADIYQVAFYAGEIGVDRAFLVYPSSTALPFFLRHRSGITIQSLSFDLTGDLDEAGDRFTRSLLERLDVING